MSAFIYLIKLKILMWNVKEGKKEIKKENILKNTGKKSNVKIL